LRRKADARLMRVLFLLDKRIRHLIHRKRSPFPKGKADKSFVGRYCVLQSGTSFVGRNPLRLRTPPIIIPSSRALLRGDLLLIPRWRPVTISRMHPLFCRGDLPWSPANRNIIWDGMATVPYILYGGIRFICGFRRMRSVFHRLYLHHLH